MEMGATTTHKLPFQTKINLGQGKLAFLTINKVALKQHLTFYLFKKTAVVRVQDAIIIFKTEKTSPFLTEIIIKIR